GARCSSWAGVCPGNNESGGKRKRAPALRGNPWLRTTLIECAWGASNKNESAFQSRYQRLAPRIGHKRAIVAVAHSLVLTLFEVLQSGQVYAGAGADRMPSTKVKRLIVSVRESPATGIKGPRAERSWKMLSGLRDQAFARAQWCGSSSASRLIG